MVPARLLDLTRLVSRLGAGPLTGVDRVELAYLQALLRSDAPLYCLVSTAAGFLLLDRAGAQGVASLIAGAPLVRADLLSRLTNRRNPQRGRAETAVRRLAVARAARPLLSWLLRRLPDGSSYLNVGHANLSDRTLATLHRRFRIAVLLHDTIPLDHPAFCRPDTVNSFRSKLDAVAAHADLVIHTTQTTRNTTDARLWQAGRVPPGVVASLGVPSVPKVATPDDMPAGLPPADPYFVTLGTIEPRKNHALLVQVWAELARTGPPPPLVVLGGRGWATPQVFADLAATPGIRVLSGLPDHVVAGLVQGAAALLFPSLAEGFGLPPLEAAALGTPVVASDLPVTREVSEAYPIYLGPTDCGSWVETIRSLSAPDALRPRPVARIPPQWENHFNLVLNIV